jgi:hypothetical protein
LPEERAKLLTDFSIKGKFDIIEGQQATRKTEVSPDLLTKQDMAHYSKVPFAQMLSYLQRNGIIPKLMVSGKNYYSRADYKAMVQHFLKKGFEYKSSELPASEENKEEDD